MFFGDIELARRLEVSAAYEMAEYARVLAETGLSPDAKSIEVGDGWAVFTGKHLPINRASGLGMNTPVTADQIDAVEAFFKAVEMPCRIEICPLADWSLAKLVNERGGYQLERFSNQHWRAITKADATPPPTGEIAIGEAITPAEKKAWVLATAQGFSGKDEPPPDDINFPLMTASSQRANVKNFLAHIGDEIVGGGAVSFRGGIATLFSASVRPQFRKRGVQKALAEARLAAAWEAGCDLATVLTMPGNNSQRNMERQGFRTAYTRVMLSKNL